MKIQIRSDSVEIEGYVNAIERNSRPLRSRIGEFVERICKGAFKRAINRNKDIHILLNHDWNKDLGSTKQGNLELEEDNIGLKARATITDPEIIEKAKRGDLIGWSFGFEDRDVNQKLVDGMLTREVKDLDLYEVSLIDRRKRPAYEGTLVTVRSESETQYIGDVFIADLEVRVAPEKEEQSKTREETQPKQQDVEKIDYSEYDKIIKELKED